MEKIDILLAAYNGEKYIEKQLDSILNQSFKNFRLLISDDCSTDSTREILKKYEKRDSRIKVFFQDNNLGVVKNFEFLLKQVKSFYFMFSDQDDYWIENKIELSLKKMEEENADLVYTDLEIVDENLNVVKKSFWKEKGFIRKIKKYNNFNSLLLNNYVTGCTMLCKSSFIEQIIPLPEDSKYIYHDFWTVLIVAQNGKLAYIDKPTIKYRQHVTNSIGAKKYSDTLSSIDEIRNHFIDVKLDLFNTYMKNIERFSDDLKPNFLKALDYFNKLKNNKRISIKDYFYFFKLYKYENFDYKLKNFIILNLRNAGKILGMLFFKK